MHVFFLLDHLSEYDWQTSRLESVWCALHEVEQTQGGQAEGEHIRRRGGVLFCFGFRCDDVTFVFDEAEFCRDQIYGKTRNLVLYYICRLNS